LLTGGQSFETELPGVGAYHFRYSGNVSSVTLEIGKVIVYRGEPISSYEGKRGPMRVSVERVGPFSIEITNECEAAGVSRSAESDLVAPAEAGAQVLSTALLDSGPGFKHSGVTFLRRNDDND
jgi:hypothetical protein